MNSTCLSFLNSGGNDYRLDLDEALFITQYPAALVRIYLVPASSFESRRRTSLLVSRGGFRMLSKRRSRAGSRGLGKLSPARFND